MPTYEFRCENDHVFGIERPITDYPQAADCPECGLTTTKRVYSVSLIRGAFRSNAGSEPARSGADETMNPRPGWNTMTNCVISNCGTGIKMGQGTRIRSRGLRLIDNGVGIDNDGGVFDGPDTKFE